MDFEEVFSRHPRIIIFPSLGESSDIEPTDGGEQSDDGSSAAASDDDPDGEKEPGFLSKLFPMLTGLAIRSRIVVIAGGDEKIAGLRAVLKSGCADGLITDEATARALAG